MFSGYARRRQRGTATFDSCGSSDTHFSHLIFKFSGNSSSQSTPAIHISCIRTFALTVNGAKNWSGSNRLAIAQSTFRLVCALLLMSGCCTWKVKTSLSASHMTPRVLVFGKISLSKSMVGSQSSFGMSSITTGSLEDHYLNLKPATAKRVDSWRRRCWALSTISQESSTSSTYIESSTVLAAWGKSKACVLA